MNNMRKLWINARLDGTIDSMKEKDVLELAGYYYPDSNGKWEVITLWEGEGFTCNSQKEAVSLANQTTIIGLLILAKMELENGYKH